MISTWQIPGYRLERELGRGGMGRVYLAWQEGLGRQVAIKVIDAGDEAPDSLQTHARREGAALARLQHPHIVAIYDGGRLADGRHYLIMEYVEGGDLAQRIRPDMPWEQVRSIMLALTDALAYAHQQGVVHRDLKPQNILFNRNEQPLLADFGVAKLLSSNVTTRTQKQVGTAAYMAPEQALGKKIGPCADLYALGVIFYELLTGSRPFDVEDPSDPSAGIALIFKHVHDPIPRLPAALTYAQAVIDKLLAKEPEQRYPSAETLRTALLALQPGSTRPLPTPSPAPPIATTKPASSRYAWLAGLVLAIGAAVGTGIYLSTPTPQTDPQQAEAERKNRETREAAEAQRKAEAERRDREARETAEAQRKAEAERKNREAREAAEAQRKAEAERKNREAREAAEAQRKAEAERRDREAREAAETQRKAEAERKAQEAREAAETQRKAEAERKAQEAREAAEAQRKAEAERKNREAREAAETQRKAEAERKNRETREAAETQRKAEAERKNRETREAAETQRKAEAERRIQELETRRRLREAEADEAAETRRETKPRIPVMIGF